LKECEISWELVTLLTCKLDQSRSILIRNTNMNYLRFYGHLDFWGYREAIANYPTNEFYKHFSLQKWSKIIVLQWYKPYKI
jgi:hypothetical protein